MIGGMTHEERARTQWQWRSWFALVPVRLIDGRWAWLQWVERRGQGNAYRVTPQ